MQTSSQRCAPDWIARAIAAVQIIGGAAGAGVACLAFWQTGGEGWFFLLLFLAAYAWCIVAGVKLWRQRPGGRAHSIAVQLLQVPWIVTPNLSYRFCAGVGQWFGFGSDGLIDAHAIASRFDFGWASGFGPAFDARPWHVAINVVAAAMAGYLIWRGRGGARARA